MRILLISGWGAPAASLLPLRNRLHAAHPVEVLDHPALVGTAEPGAAIAVDDFARQLARRCAAEKKPVIMAGWSMGGMLAIEAAQQFPDVIKGLILIGSTSRFCAGEGYPHGPPVVTVRAMAQELARRPGAILGDFFRLAAAPVSPRPAEMKKLVQNAQAMGIPLLRAGLNYLETRDLRDAARTLALPTLVLHGREDRVIPAAAAAFLREIIPQSRLIAYDGCGHDFAARRADLLAGDLLPFVNELA